MLFVCLFVFWSYSGLRSPSVSTLLSSNLRSGVLVFFFGGGGGGEERESVAARESAVGRREDSLRHTFALPEKKNV